MLGHAGDFKAGVASEGDQKPETAGGKPETATSRKSGTAMGQSKNTPSEAVASHKTEGAGEKPDTALSAAAASHKSKTEGKDSVKEVTNQEGQV